MLSLLFFLCSAKFSAGYNFPSFVTENATMAIFVDKEFFNDEGQYDYYLLEIRKIIQVVTQKYLTTTFMTIRILQDLHENFQNDYIVLFTVMKCQKTWLTFKKAQMEELVYIAITDSDCPRLPKEESISIPITQPGLELPQILLDLKVDSVLSFKQMNIILDDTFDDDNIDKILKAISTDLLYEKIKFTSSTLFKIKHVKNMISVKKQVERILANFHLDQLGQCFMVIVTIDIVKIMMEVANTLKLVHPRNQWLYVIGDGPEKDGSITYFSSMSTEGENVAFIYNVTLFNNNCHINSMCYIRQLMRIVTMSIENFALSEPELDEKIADEEINSPGPTKIDTKYKIIHYIYAELSKKKNVDNSCGRCLSWKITSTITWGNSFVAANETESLLDTGFWSLDIGITMQDTLFPHLKHGFRGKTLPIVTYHNPPWQIVKVTRTGERRYEGFIFDILMHLSRKMNFTYKVLIPQNDETKLISDNYDSNILMLSDNAAVMSMARKIPEEVSAVVKEKRVFLGACAFSMLTKTTQGVNHTLPISMQSYSLLAPNPVTLSRALLFIAPYTAETWLCLASSIVIIGPLLYLVQKCCLYILQDVQDTSGFQTPWECIWYIYGALLQQGGMHLPRMSSARIIVGIWWLVVMVLIATYSGTLVAFLTFPRMDDAISSVDDLLARKDEFTWGFPNGSILEEYLKDMNDEKYNEFLRRSERHDTSNLKKIVERIKGKKHVFIDWTTSLRFLMKTDFLTTGFCHFTLASVEFINEPIAMLVAEDSPYLHMINGELRRMHESGLIKKWSSNRMPIKDQCWDGRIINAAATKHKVNMGDMQGIFFVLAMGYTLAMIIIGCEFFCHRRKVARERNLVRPFIN